MGFGNSFNGGVSIAIADGSITTPKYADSSITTAKYADNSVTEAKLASTFKQTLFNKNLLINPNFQVNQSDITGTLPNSLALPTASLGYPSGSNWCFAASGSSAVAYAIDSANESVTFTGATDTTEIYLLERLESKDITTLANKLATLTLSAEISNSLLTSVIWEVFRPTTSNDVHGTIASPTQTLIDSGTFTVNSTLTRYSASFALPALAVRGLEIRLRVGAQISGTWTVARLQLEEGGITTSFNCGDHPSELLKCQRYYKIARSSLRGNASVSGGILANEMIWDMFATPVNILTSTVAQRDNVDASFPQLSNLSAYGGTVSIVSVATGDFYDSGRIWNLLAHIP